jgi:hypothetical protein
MVVFQCDSYVSHQVLRRRIRYVLTFHSPRDAQRCNAISGGGSRGGPIGSGAGTPRAVQHFHAVTIRERYTDEAGLSAQSATCDYELPLLAAVEPEANAAMTRRAPTAVIAPNLSGERQPELGQVPLLKGHDPLFVLRITAGLIVLR